MRNFSQRIYSFFHPALSKNVLGIFRIAFASLLLIEALAIGASLTELFGESGFLDAKLMRVLGIQLIPNHPEFWSWTGLSFPQLLHGVYSLYVASIVGLLIGFKTRLSTVLLWITQALFMNCSYLGVYGVDRYFQLILFLSIFCPWGEALAWDSGFKRNTDLSQEHGFWLRIFQIAIAMTYTNAGVAKALGTDWWTGTAIFRAVHLPEFHQWNLLWLGDYPFLPKLLGWATVLGEAFFLLVLFSRRIRFFLVFSMLLMHLGIGTFMGLYLFAATMVVLDFSLFVLPDITTRRSKMIFSS